MTRMRTATALTALLLAGPAWAQTLPPGSFQSLSPGNQTIAHALFEAQVASPTGPAPLTLDEIAALKRGNGWGNVFNEMQAEGLVQAKNLGQVVSGYEREAHVPGMAGGPVVVTTASGRIIASGSRAANAKGDGLAGDGHGKFRASADGDAVATNITTAGGVSPGGGPSLTHGDMEGGSVTTHGGGLSHGAGGVHGR